ncbi:AraC family transcriptional regulator [Marinobacter nanhaiticus D15-8W]|uniref:AraC family transcriptional regulator n=1 Tax=Marinobacter nanhaiticus D15-8W TaxID=626887 RepID=N6X648_9GAMM|nr:AraC family transcriptional regulator [Marinobacter nanhaiticus]ENO16578.1 AraC family transcriptional regulator [Marinobacter nanhaiticus D15-8W]BES72375.1 AraC family transcriptional regulator [Marinobacter nanhaiticus D15-8W]
MDFDAKLIPLHRHPLGFIEAFCSLGARQEELLKGTGISPATFDMQEVYISYNQIHALIRNGIRLCPLPAVGVHVGMRFDWCFWGPVGFAVYCSPSLKDAAEAFKRYMVTAQPFYTMVASQPNAYLDADNRVVEPLDYPTADDRDPMVRQFIHEFRLAVSLRIWDMCGNKSVDDPSIHVRLTTPKPEDTSLYDSLPCTSITFDCDESSISGQIDFAFKRFRLLRLRTFERLVRQCERELSRMPAHVTFADRVRWHIRAHFKPDINLEQVATQLSMTPRSLTRRLAGENASFRRILHEVRMEIASHQLRFSRLSVEDVSEITGFSCASSLRRAMKNWTGTTISQIREAVA